LSPQSVDWISRALSVGVVAPKATPAEIIDKLNQEFGKLIVDQTEKWAKVSSSQT
jgi:tripartite-type tricarboxylate transporter receptor subunit TctC